MKRDIINLCLKRESVRGVIKYINLLVRLGTVNHVVVKIYSKNAEKAIEAKRQSCDTPDTETLINIENTHSVDIIPCRKIRKKLDIFSRTPLEIRNLLDQLYVRTVIKRVELKATTIRAMQLNTGLILNGYVLHAIKPFIGKGVS